MSSTKIKLKIKKKSNTIYVKGSAKIEHHLWKRFWKNKTPSIERFCKNQISPVENILQKSNTSIEKILYEETSSMEKITRK